MGKAFTSAGNGISGNVEKGAYKSAFDVASLKPGVVSGLKQSLRTSYGHEGPTRKMTLGL